MTNAYDILQTVYPPVSWVVKKLIPVHSVNIVAGASSSGKSRLAYDIVAAVLTEDGDWLGHSNGLGRSGRVLYIDMEHDDAEIQERLAPLKLSSESLRRLDFEPAVSMRGDEIAELVHRKPYDLVVFDPLLFIKGFSPSRDVGNNAEIAESMKKILSLAHESSGPAFLLVSYVNKTFLRGDNLKAGLDINSSEASAAVLGATALFASCSTRIILYMGEGEHRKITLGGKRLRWSTIRVVLDKDTGRYRWPMRTEAHENESYRGWLASEPEHDVPVPGAKGWPAGKLVNP